MKYLVLLGDGMADFPRDDCGGTTPLAFASTPSMDAMAREGVTGLFNPIPEPFPAGSDIGNLSVFGYNPAETFTGRAPLEAANQGIQLGANELAFRCNLVTIEGDTLRDFTADHISTEEATEIVHALNEAIGGETVRFSPGVSYRHLAIVTADEDHYAPYKRLSCTPPHDIIGQRYAEHLPRGEKRDPIVALMEASQKILAEHPLNRARIDAGKLPATSIWLWGQGGAPSVRTYPDRFGISGAVISAVDLVNGIGRCAGLEVIAVEGATGYLDTNYEGKVAAALDAFDRHDFVYLHIEAPDEASHEGKTELKLQAIEDFDMRVVGPCLDYARKRGDLRVVVAPDHVTALSTRTHAGGPVPFILWGEDVASNGLSCYSEAEAAKAGILFSDGHALVPRMIDPRPIAADGT